MSSSAPPTEQQAGENRTRSICEWFWVRLPLLAQHMSRRLGAITGEGYYLAARPGTGALLPPFAFTLGLACGWFHPGFEQIVYQSWFVLGSALLLAALSGQLGLLFVVGYAFGNMFLGPATPSGAPSWTELPLEVGVPLLIEYLVLGLFLSQLSTVSKALARQVPLPKRWIGGRRFAALALLEAAAAALMVWGWVRALPIVLRPRFTWSGAPEPADAMVAIQQIALALAGMAAIVTLARLALQHRTAFSAACRPWLDHLDRLRQSVPASAKPLVEHIPPLAALALQVLLGLGLMAGLMDAWIDALVALAVLGIVQAARKGILPVLGGWPALAARLPVIVRMLVGIAVLALAGPMLLWFFFGQASGMRPLLFITLFSLVIFLLLLPPAPSGEKNADGGGASLAPAT